jgi:hypothetical protein
VAGDSTWRKSDSGALCQMNCNWLPGDGYRHVNSECCLFGFELQKGLPEAWCAFTPR